MIYKRLHGKGSAKHCELLFLRCLPLLLFEAESLPDRCPDCGKTGYQNRPAIRPATEKEVQDLLRARDEEWE